MVPLDLHSFNPWFVIDKPILLSIYVKLYRSRISVIHIPSGDRSNS